MTPKPIEPWLYEDLVHYFKYASSAYTALCPRPNGRVLVSEISNSYTDIQGYVARDDERRELIVALRGSLSMTDILLDASVVLVPFISPGVTAPDGVKVHSGFLAAWNSVALEVIAIVTEELERLAGCGYSLVATGHSLGGALATMAIVALRQRFTGVPVTKLYSYGAPRVGNAEFANWVNQVVGRTAFRVVHAKDGVPTMIPTSMGYAHHGVEYWQKCEPPAPENTVRCACDGEDPKCSASVPSEGINEDHMQYFGIIATTPFCW
ncbi:alpha/beta-hydrolase [Schizophyllum commune H4-8]|nr:alpha/beta-hydrolase [Schizophyllum commune H4-8]KAI5891636.1 alpha/beta-hydrolase [Schizophyllum commune H4-8]